MREGHMGGRESTSRSPPADHHQGLAFFRRITMLITGGAVVAWGGKRTGALLFLRCRHVPGKRGCCSGELGGMGGPAPSVTRSP